MVTRRIDALSMHTQTLVAILIAALPIVANGPAAHAEGRERPARSDGYLDNLWIGTRSDPDAPCPDAGPSWSTAPLFAGEGGKPGLAVFCRYGFQGPGHVGAADIAALQALVPARLSALGRDAMTVGSSAPPVWSEALWKPLARHFLAQAGEVEALAPMLGDPAVRLAVLDSTPTAEEDPHLLIGNGPHGHALLNMAHRLLCTGTPDACGVKLTSRLALSYLAYGPDFEIAPLQDPVNGGYVGTISELAAAVHDEIAAWEAAPNPLPRLVLNLSVGWNPTFGGLEPLVFDMPVPVQAMYRALEHAACREALVVAAAGNRSGGPSPAVGAVLPAAWNALPAPACPDTRSPGNGDGPLVYAVGGVVSDGRPLGNARPGSASRWAAYGDHGVAGTDADLPTAILTGSSVSTLVVSAAAAAAWAQSPELSRAAIMDLLYEVGDPLPRAAEICLAPSGGICTAPVHRVSVCRAAQAACALTGGPCPPCAAWNPTTPDLTASFDDLDPAAIIDLALISEPYGQTTACDPDVPHFDPIAGPAADPCPDRQYTSVAATPWVHPQPGSDPCPPCRVNRSSQTMVIEIDPAYDAALSAPTLTLCGTAYSLDGLSLAPGALNEVTNVDATGCSSAELSFTVTNTDGSLGSAISSAIIVE